MMFVQSVSSQDLLLYFYTKEPLVCDAILLLLSLYLYRYTYFFVSPPFSSLISSVLMFRNPHLRSIIDYIMWTAISFLHLCMI